IDITDRELTVSRPIILRSDLELILEDGVVLAAAPGAFKGRADAMLSGTNVERITIQGKGKATLRMRKSDYQNPDLYPHSEWRHLIALRGAKGVTLRNLNLLSSGGDGIYLGCSPKMPYCM